MRISPLFACLLVSAPPGSAQETAGFEHPRLPLAIEAPSDWEGATWPGDPGLYEVSAWQRAG